VGGHQGGGRHLGQIAGDGSTHAGQHFRRPLLIFRFDLSLIYLNLCFVLVIIQCTWRNRRDSCSASQKIVENRFT